MVTEIILTAREASQDVMLLSSQPYTTLNPLTSVFFFFFIRSYKIWFGLWESSLNVFEVLDPVIWAQKKFSKRSSVTHLNESSKLTPTLKFFDWRLAGVRKCIREGERVHLEFTSQYGQVSFYWPQLHGEWKTHTHTHAHFTKSNGRKWRERPKWWSMTYSSVWRREKGNTV